MDRKFTWNTRKAAENNVKHGVTFEEARDAFQDKAGLIEFDEKHSDLEDRFILIARSPRFRILFVVHADITESFTRIISARKAIT